MHEGCAGRFENGKQVVDKLRAMGFSSGEMPMSHQLECVECGEEFLMTTFETKCPGCGMVYGVTPCHSTEAENVQAAGKDY